MAENRGTKFTMSDWKITIEGSGPCLDGSPYASDEGAKMLVRELMQRGHGISRAEFRGNGKLPADITQTPVEREFQDATKGIAVNETVEGE